MSEGACPSVSKLRKQTLSRKRFCAIRFYCTETFFAIGFFAQNGCTWPERPMTKSSRPEGPPTKSRGPLGPRLLVIITMQTL